MSRINLETLKPLVAYVPRITKKVLGFLDKQGNGDGHFDLEDVKEIVQAGVEVIKDTILGQDGE